MTTDEKFVPGPRADYFCARDVCDGGSSPENPYRDLPVKKPRCPACGATRWMKRLYSGYSPLVSTEAGRRGIAANEMVGPEFDRQKGKQIQAQRARTRPGPMGPISLTSMARVGGVVEASTGGKIQAHQIAAQLPQTKGIGIPGRRIGELGGVPQPNAPRAWRGGPQDRQAIQEATPR